MLHIADRIRRIALMAIGLIVFAWAGAEAAVIITVTGERIVCEIVEEHDEYFIIDHMGYRRYILKDQVREVDRSERIDIDLNPLRARSLGVFSGYYHSLEKQDQDLAGLRVSYAHGVSKHVALEANYHYGRGRINDQMGSKLFPGDMTWHGGTLGMLWNTKVWGAYAFVETGAGYIEFSHELDDDQRDLWSKYYSAIYAPPGVFGDFDQDPRGGLAIVVGAGAMYPITRWLILETRASMMFIDGQGRDRITYPPVPDDPFYASGEHVNTYELFQQMAQFSVGLRFAF